MPRQSLSNLGLTTTVGDIIDKVFQARLAAYQGGSPGTDIDKFSQTFNWSKHRCICGQCQETYDYVGTKGVERHQRRLTDKRSENLLPIARASV
jgi:hypothetical protein